MQLMNPTDQSDAYLLILVVFDWVFFKHFVSLRLEVVHERLKVKTKFKKVWFKIYSNLNVAVPVVGIVDNPRSLLKTDCSSPVVV
jgi:hypothetical protein